MELQPVNSIDTALHILEALYDISYFDIIQALDDIKVGDMLKKKQRLWVTS